MAGNNNPFYVKPAVIDASPIMQGIGGLIKQNREERKREELKQGLMGAYNTGSPDSVAEFISNNPESGAALNSMMKFRSDKTGGNYNESLRTFLSNPTRENLKQQIASRSQFVREQGGDPSDTEAALAQFDEDPSGFVQQAEMALASRDPKGFKAYQEKRGGDNKKFLEEERKTASQDVRNFNKQAKEMRTSYGKLQGLAEQAKGGDRGARNAMVVSVGRLMSPGIFTETEASALSGGQNTMQAVIAALAGKGVDVDALQRSFDPYGDSFDADALLQIGETIVASSRQPLVDMYESSRKRAETAGMSKRAFDTNFGGNPNYDFLTNFGADKQPAANPAPAPEAALQRLQSNPSLINDFEQMYGYRPEGY